MSLLQVNYLLLGLAGASLAHPLYVWICCRRHRQSDADGDTIEVFVWKPRLPTIYIWVSEEKSHISWWFKKEKEDDVNMMDQKMNT